MNRLNVLRVVFCILTVMMPVAAASLSYYSFEQARDLYQQGEYKEAETLFRQHAEDNDPRAQHYLGLIQLHGHTGERDPAKACDWFEKAADNDYLDAFYEFGNCYLKGEGREADIDQALYLYGVAAEHGHVNSQYRLARLYASGSVVPKNSERAYIYLFLALQGDLSQAPVLRDSLEAELSEKKLQRAQNFALKLLERQSRHDRGRID